MKTCVASPELARMGSSWPPVERQLTPAPPRPGNETEKSCDTVSLRSLCEGCDSKENCREKAFLGTPVILQDRCVGVISLIAVTHEQQEHISDNLREFSDYVRPYIHHFCFETSGGSGPGDNISKYSRP
ncbi:transcriptional regulator [Escherichia coli]|uniref:Transcriptional regulator n=1 Tax=Escherichia coli TaxID=562 RepID=A0A376UG01_ECOLX|nr:transcriptional regulator [Escherichia coli]